MRKTFLTLCAATFALLAVSSCGKLEDGLDSLKKEVADLKDRVTALETKLNNDVKTINDVIATLATKQELATGLNGLDADLAEAVQEVTATLAGLDAKYAGKVDFNTLKSEVESGSTALNSQLQHLAGLLGETNVAEMKAELLAELAEAVRNVAVQTVTKNDDGTYTLTLANGDTFDVAEPDANANNAGLVTVKDGEWVVLAEDGTYEPIGVPVGVEDLVFSVDYETKELMFSVNGGEPEGTGAYVSDWDGTIVTDLYEDDNFVYITIGGTEYTLVKASKAESNLLAGKTYFTAGQTKTVKFDVKDVKSGFVAVTPKGWEAELDFAGKTLTVTAPAEGEGAASGTVEVWFLTNDGVVISSVLQVVAGPAVIDIVVTADDEVTMTFNEVDGVVPEVIYGATLASEFTDEFVEELLANLLYAPYSGYFSNVDDANPDIVSLRKTGFTGTMADLVADLEYGAEYVVWAIEPVWEYSSSAHTYVSKNSATDFVKVYHKVEFMNFEVTPSLTDAEFTIELRDPAVQGFYGFYVSPYMEWFLDSVKAGDFKVYDILIGTFGTELPCRRYSNNTETLTLKYYGVADAYIDYGMYNTISALSTHTVCIVPVYADKAASDYTYDDIIIKKVSTAEVTLGSDITCELLEEEQSYQYNYMTFSAPDAAYAMYYIYGPGEEVPADDNAVIDAILEYYIPNEFMSDMFEGTFAINHDNSWGETPGQTYTLKIVLVDSDARASVVTKTFSTKEMPLNETLEVAVDAYIDELTNNTVATFEVTAGTAAKLYWTCNIGSSASLDNQIAVLEGNTSNWNEVDLSTAELVNGVYTITGFAVKSYSYKDQYNYVHAILVDEDGAVSNEVVSAAFLVPKGYVLPTL